MTEQALHCSACGQRECADMTCCTDCTHRYREGVAPEGRVLTCRCAEGAYLGAQPLGTPTRCERCRGLVDDRARELLTRLYAESSARLEAWAAANSTAARPLTCPVTSATPAATSSVSERTAGR